ncbi:hypothetical protein ACB092_08G100100 [Castanea dentata]
MGHSNSRLKRVQVLDDLQVTDLPKASENHIKENFSIDGNMTPKSNSKKATAFTKKRSFKDEILRRVFSEDYEKEKKRIMDPQGKTIKTWNKIFSLSCLFALFLDPLFLLLPVIDGQGCVANGMTAQVVLTILRSVTDVFYLIQIIVRFHTAYVAPSSRVVGRGELVIDPSKIAMRYLRKGFIIDLMASLPLTQVSGSWWYLLGIERQDACWRSACNLESSCRNEYFDCHTVNDDARSNWFSSTNVTNLCTPTSNFYQYGIFGDALNSNVIASPFFNKYFYCLWWGLRNVSSTGQNLTTSTYMGEVVFTIIFVATLGLFLFALLIGNMQRYLQSATLRLEERRIRRTDTEQWMHHRQLPSELKQSVRQYDQSKWFTTKGVNEETLLDGLPMDLRREIKRHLCLSLVRRVPLFDQMDETLLDAICESLRPALCTNNMFIVREGDPVNQMMFIVRGHLDSYTTDGGRFGFFNSSRLGSGGFCGEELLTWALDPRPNVILPTSTRTVKAITEVEGFALVAEDLKFVASQFRRLHSKQLRHTLRHYSHQWRTWAACFIQAAWRRHKKLKKMAKNGISESGRPLKETFWSKYAEAFVEKTRSRRFVLESGELVSTTINSLQKPVEVDFD